MTKRFFLLMLVFFVSHGALAEWSGRWSGQGSSTDPLGSTKECYLLLTLQESSEELRFLESYADCNPLKQVWSDRVYQKRGSRLYLDGAQVGRIRSRSIEIDQLEPSNFRATFKIEDTRRGDYPISFSYEFIANGESEGLKITGALEAQ